MPVVLIRDSRGVERTRPLDRDIVVFGRSPDCTLILEGRGVSRLHGRFVRDPFGRWWVEDLGAKNGIFVEGRPVSRHRLADGESVAVGELTLTYFAREAGATGGSPSTITICDAMATSATTFERSPDSLGAMDTRRLATLYTFCKRLMEQRGVASLVEIASTALISELDAEIVVMGLTRDPEREPDRVIVRPTDVSTTGIMLSRSVLTRTIQGRRAVLVSDTHADRGLASAESIVSGGIRSALCVPMLRNEDVTGFIYVDSRRRGRSYEERDLEFASAVGVMVGTAIENARLHEAELVKQRMEAELERARAVQQAILPSDWPAVAGWEIHGLHATCREVGGDYVDAILSDDGRLWLLIADVCGKGAGAAMVASSIHAATHALVDQCGAPGRLLARLNDLLVRHEVGMSFVTFLAVCLDTRTGDAVIASAGHPAPIYLGSAAPPTPVPMENGFMLGVFPDAVFPDTRWLFPASPGTLVMYTDGISEAFDERDHQYGDERMLACLAANGMLVPEQLVATVLRDVEVFRGRHEPSDDLTILACRRAATA